ncbi:MAG: fatty acid desaturase, partial [Planctomycetota bacterium]
YVQHQFPGVYWGRGKTWSYTAAALDGSSYYRLPKLLQWFSANIGFHHVHHLDARIPNYNLARCHREIERFGRTPALGLWESRRSLRLALWDEQAGELVGFARLKRKD